MTQRKPACRQQPACAGCEKGAAAGLAQAVQALLAQRAEFPLFEHVSPVPIPTFADAVELVELARQLIFPGFFSPSPITEANIAYNMGQVADKFQGLLAREIAMAIRHDCRRYNLDCSDCAARGEALAMEVTRALPELRSALILDVRAALEGDPAAGDHYDQTIFCYPGLFAILVQRLAHRLYKAGVPFLPRILTEYAHSRTGIDIHPGAEIGERFFIDHGTGVVIGETTVIGDRVRLYQGVTLGALSVPKEAVRELSGQKRHPTIEDDVTVYSGATILGGDTVIGAGSVVGGNVWLTESIPPGTRVMLKKPGLIITNGRG